MAGRGPAPKDPKRRARTNSDPVATTVIAFEPAPAPPLPEVMPNGNAWPDRTREWWQLWQDSPLSEHFGATDWSELLDTAVLHGLFWTGSGTTVAAELRLRVAKFGATPEDRARLRIQFADADQRDAARPKTPSSEPSGAEKRYDGLRAV